MAAIEHLDVLIVGAGLSGISLARTLLDQPAPPSMALLEAREASGGTWDLFRYPGIRSDSQMATFGLPDYPWTDPRSIAPGGAILDYLRSAAAESGVDTLIRYGQRLERASWSSKAGHWEVDIRVGSEVRHLRATFLIMCTGYYRYDHGYQPSFPGAENYRGQLVHPQQWPSESDVAQKRIVVIGSGATAVTLVPALVERGASVTMLQRSPTYIAAVSEVDRASELRRRLLPARAAAWLNRWSGILRDTTIYGVSRRLPQLMRRLLRKGVESRLPEGYDVDRHFNPDYDPWDQRLCASPDGDFFSSVASGQAKMVTDQIETFTESGIQLQSGRTLEADMIVTATGLELQIFGDADIVVDGRQIEPRETVSFRGMMLDGVPNFAFAIGYVNASWTLKIGLIAEYVKDLLAAMREHGANVVTPISHEDPSQLRPLIDLDAGYIRRGADLLPRQSAQPRWRTHQNYIADARLFADGVRPRDLRFAGPGHRAATRSIAQ